MKTKPKEYAQLLYALINEDKNKNRKLDQLLYGFLCLVNNQGDLGKIENIIREFELYYQKKEELLTAEVVTARKLDEETVKEIKIFLKKTRPEIKNFELTEKVDPSVLGGIKIMAGDLFLDGTLKRQLINLKNSLIQ